MLEWASSVACSLCGVLVAVSHSICSLVATLKVSRVVMYLAEVQVRAQQYRFPPEGRLGYGKGIHDIFGVTRSLCRSCHRSWQKGQEAEGGIHWAATGFFVAYDPPVGRGGKASRYLVSCRHVFEGKKEMFLRINPQETEPAKTLRVKLVGTNGEPRWHTPSPAVLDVAVLPLRGVLEEEDARRIAFFSTAESFVGRVDLRSLDITEGDPVCLLGFPRGSVGRGRSLPVTRRGRITRLKNYTKGQFPVVLVDAPCLPGNSGSPVIALTNGDSKTSESPASEAYLMGVVAGTVKFSSFVNRRAARRAKSRENSLRTRVIPADFIRRSIHLHQACSALAG